MLTKTAIYNAFWRKIMLGLCLAIFFFSNAYAMSGVEKKKIDYLLTKVEFSNLAFIRNGKFYTGKDARKHLQDKINYAGNRVKTADDFINYIANGSTVSGKPYYVVLPDGKKMEAQQWLRDRLAEMPPDR